VDGRKRIRRGVHRPMDEWDVLIKDHHAAYITWDEFERNLKAIANNATGMSSALSRGAAREAVKAAQKPDAEISMRISAGLLGP
jgi:hypothetical protein